MSKNTVEYGERLRAHCSAQDLVRWKEAAGRAGARNLSEWVRWVLDKEAALVDAGARNPWVDRRTGKARQGKLEMGGRRQVVLRDWVMGPDGYAVEAKDLYDESEGL